MTRFVVLLPVLAGLLVRAQTAGVRLDNEGDPGGLRISNSGPAIALTSKVTVERLRDGKWIVTPVRFELIDRCTNTETPKCRELGAGDSFVPLRWNGYTCSGQCNRSCRSNHYAGPGEFRFVVAACDGKARFIGPEFTIPAEKRRK